MAKCRDDKHNLVSWGSDARFMRCARCGEVRATEAVSDRARTPKKRGDKKSCVYGEFYQTAG